MAASTHLPPLPERSQALAHLRAMVREGHGAAVAARWTAYALVPEQPDALRTRRAQHEAVALGAAPRVIRDVWKVRAGERELRAEVRASLVLTVGVDERGDAIEREVERRSMRIVSTQGPAARALAMRWGAEQLALVWPSASEGAKLESAALSVAWGQAPAALRDVWGATRGVLRDRGVEIWAEAVLVEAGESYRRRG